MKSDSKIRSFIAAEISPEVQDAIRVFQADLAPLFTDFRWTPPEQIHITLLFLGEISMHVLAELIEQIPQRIADIKRFSMTPMGLDAFPHSAQARVLWVGFQSVPSQLLQLHVRLSELSEMLELNLDTRRFKPHLTLARYRNVHRGSDLTSYLSQFITIIFPGLKIDHITLFRSDYKSSRPIYTRLAEFGLI